MKRHEDLKNGQTANVNNTNNVNNINNINNINAPTLNKKAIKKSKRREKRDMYDMILANMIAGNSIIEPTQKLDNSQLAIGFSNVASDTHITKYFMISKFPDYLGRKLIDKIRYECMNDLVKINFYFYGQPHRINWDSAEMKNRMNIWRKYSEEHSGAIDVFDYRGQRSESQARTRIITSTKYLNEAELEHKRSFVKVFFIIEVTAVRSNEGIINMTDTINKLKTFCNLSDIKLKELRINMIDWLRAIGPFSLKMSGTLLSKIAKKVLTDDILANFNSLKQGRIGTKGASLGMDVWNGGAVLHQFKEDPDGADNWLISAVTGGGKSYWVKSVLTYLLAQNFTVCVMDYEGDEYDNLAAYVSSGNPDDVKVVSMGKGSAVYFDPCEIADLTGDRNIDLDLKANAVNFTMAIFRTIVCGLNGSFTRDQEKIMSTAIQRMYDSVGVLDTDMTTWKYSKGLRLHDVYHEICEICESGEFRVNSEDKHKAAVTIRDIASIYFEPGEIKAGTFNKPMSANELYTSKFIIFSFGMKGADPSSTDPIILALKQLSVAYINIQISNYCKYVKKCFNVKVWEEFQRWGSIGNSESAGSSGSIIINTITGGRKRGDVNFIITNDLKALLSSDKMNATLRQNINNYVIGGIKDLETRRLFCELFDLQDLNRDLDLIAKANQKKVSGGSSGNSKYNHAFCLALSNGKKALVKVMLPAALAKSKIFKTGVDAQADV